MKTTGNGSEQACTDNLLALRRGEIALDFLRGLPPDTIDRPDPAASDALHRAIRETLATYEPRITAEDITNG